MTILVLNGSPRKNGSVAKLLEKEVERFSKKEILKSSGFRIVRKVHLAGTKNLINARSEKLVEVLKEKYPELKK